MPTFEALVRHAQGVCSLYPPMLLCVQWASRRVHELVGRRRTAIFRRNLELVIPGAVRTGTVTVSRGASLVVGDATAQAAWAALPASFPQGWHIRPKSAWYRVAGRDGANLTLESEFAEDDAASVSYSLLRMYHPTPTVVQYDESSFVLARIGLPLSFLSESELTMYFPQRWGLFMGGVTIPAYVAEVEPAPDGWKQVEVYPYPSQSELLRYSAWVEPPVYSYQDNLPFSLDLHHILPGLKIDMYTWRAGQEGVPATELQIILNEAAREMTRWEAMKEQALVYVQGSRTQGFVLARGRTVRPLHGIRTAYDEIWSRP